MLKKLIFLFFIGSVFATNETAIFSMGCFWSAQSDFDKLPGVISTTVGYDGDKKPKPSYEEVSEGGTKFAESIKVVYDPSKVSYSEVLTYFWHHIDPTVMDEQFCDHGPQYRTAIFYLNEKQKQQAMASMIQVKRQIPQVYTEIVSSSNFYPAEDYHQNYYKKNPLNYKLYRLNCGRDERIKQIWSINK
jgi:peptide-methionine (S)-S-oxide reductase